MDTIKRQIRIVADFQKIWALRSSINSKATRKNLAPAIIIINNGRKLIASGWEYTIKLVKSVNPIKIARVTVS